MTRKHEYTPIFVDPPQEEGESVLYTDPSEENNQIKDNYGQFFTTSDKWLYPQIVGFIKNEKVLDPFAGEGNIFQSLEKFGITTDFKGMDIDDKLSWPINDGLVDIPKTCRMIITNPPYLAKNSATRKNLESKKYFKDTNYTDLYQIALVRMLESHGDIIAIVPETFLNAPICEERLRSVTVVEDALFSDTDCPVCIVCYDGGDGGDTRVYKGDQYCGTLKQLKKHIKTPRNDIDITFNVKDGNMGLRAVDGVGVDCIRFCIPEELNYPLDKIKNSSRAITLIKVVNPDIVTECNEIVRKYRDDTCDILLSPFKGNKKSGSRRRRLDFRTARAIIEEATRHVSK